MQVKFNEPTPQRPAGPRLLDAQMVSILLPSIIDQLKREESWKDSDRNAITVFKTDGLRMVVVAMHQGAEMPTHSADGIISVQVLQGQIQFATAQQTTVLDQHQALVLHKGIPHSVIALEESVFLLTIATGCADNETTGTYVKAQPYPVK